MKLSTKLKLLSRTITDGAVNDYDIVKETYRRYQAHEFRKKGKLVGQVNSCINFKLQIYSVHTDISLYDFNNKHVGNYSRKNSNVKRKIN